MAKRSPKEILVRWINAGLAKDGKTISGLAAVLDIPQPRVSEMKVGKRDVQVGELQPIAEYLEEPIPSEIAAPLPHKAIPVVGWVSAGALTGNIASDDILGTVETETLPPGDWIALKVTGDSMDLISPPDSVIFVNRRDKQLVPNGLYVIDDGEGSTTYKRYRPGPPPRFEPVSTRKGIDPIFFDNEPTVVGRVRRSVLEM